MHGPSGMSVSSHEILLPNPAAAAGSISHLTGVGPPVAGEFKQAPQLPKKKDLKEWYV